jgi:hypothetical protein
MASTKVSALAAASAIADADLVPVVQSATSKQATALQMKTYVDQNIRNMSTSTAGPGFATDTYLAGSACVFSASKLRIATQYRLFFSVSKTAAGLVAPTINLRIGTSGVGAVGDASRLLFTFPTQTAAIDEGLFQIYAGFRSVGSGTSAVMAGAAVLNHELIANTSTGLSSQANPVVTAVGSGFDSTTGVVIGASVNGGTAAAWTIVLVQADLVNLI